MDKIINLTLVAIIFICGWTGYKKGIIMGAGGIVVVIASLITANILSNSFSYEIIPVLRPFVSGYMEPQIREAVYEELSIDPEIGSDYSINDLITANPAIVNSVLERSIGNLGIWGSASDVIAEESELYMWQNGLTCHDALTEILCEKISYAMGFAISFTLISIALTVIGNIPNISFRLPYFEMADEIAGTILGAITGIMFCFVIVWILKFTGKIISEDTVMKASVATLLLRIDLVSIFTGI